MVHQKKKKNKKRVVFHFDVNSVIIKNPCSMQWHRNIRLTPYIYCYYLLFNSLGLRKYLISFTA